MELTGPCEVALGFLHVQARPLNLRLGSGALIEQVGVINRHQQLAFLHALARRDKDAANLAADFRLHIDLQRGFYLSSQRQLRSDVGKASLGGWKILGFFGSGKGRPALVKSGASKSKNSDDYGKVFGHGVITLQAQGAFSTNTAAAAV